MGYMNPANRGEAMAIEYADKYSKYPLPDWYKYYGAYLAGMKDAVKGVSDAREMVDALLGKEITLHGKEVG
jgi:hypothetical protein